MTAAVQADHHTRNAEGAGPLLRAVRTPLFNLSFWVKLVRLLPAAPDAYVTEIICGRSVPEIVPGPRAPQSERIRNGFRYVTFMLFFMLFGGHAARLEQILSSVDLTPGATVRETYAKIDHELPKLGEGWFRHVASTMLPGLLVGALPQLLAKGSQPTAQHSAVMAQVLTGTTDVESVDIARGINQIVAALIEYDGPQLERFVTLNADEGRRFLEHEASAHTRQEYAAYLKRHGHRCILEMELREKEWAEDPTPIVDAVQSGVRATRAGHVRPSRHELASVPLLVRMFVKIGQRGIRERERAKSQVILLTTLFKRAYRALARQMVEEGLLPDPDLVFFLQHAELGELLREPNSRLVEQAIARREVLPYRRSSTLSRIPAGRPSRSIRLVQAGKASSVASPQAWASCEDARVSYRHSPKQARCSPTRSSSHQSSTSAGHLSSRRSPGLRAMSALPCGMARSWPVSTASPP